MTENILYSHHPECCMIESPLKITVSTVANKIDKLKKYGLNKKIIDQINKNNNHFSDVYLDKLFDSLIKLFERGISFKHIDPEFEETLLEYFSHESKSPGYIEDRLLIWDANMNNYCQLKDLLLKIKNTLNIYDIFYIIGNEIDEIFQLIENDKLVYTPLLYYHIQSIELDLFARYTGVFACVKTPTESFIYIKDLIRDLKIAELQNENKILKEKFKKLQIIIQ